ncbi:MAG: hypothetical protein GY793_07710 [Proteobacteria bacterium]|nr:hypothetical protein [Pseudomonadota bacterium]
MRKRFNPILTLAATPISEVKVKPNKRDKVTSILLGLQFIYKTSELNEKIFDIIEKKIVGDKKPTGRNGMDLWYILVLSTLRVGLDYGYDQITHMANNDMIVRKILGIDDFFTGEEPKEFGYRTIHENISKLDCESIEEINGIVCEYGERLFKKKRMRPSS